MSRLTKYDVLIYLSNGGVAIDELIARIRQNAFFAGTSERRIRQIISALMKEGIISRSKGMLSLTERAADMLAFLLWLRKDSIDYNVPLRNVDQALFRMIFESGEVNLVSKSMFSKPTTLKISRELENINFITFLKKKPLVAKANYTDKTIFFSNALEYNFDALQNMVKLEKIEKDSQKLKEHFVKLHVYSTTVTEGNTATERDVERVLRNLDTDLSPREVIEIVNAKKSVDELYNSRNEELSIALIKKLHGILMANLVEQPGEFSYVKKRLIGSATKLPDSKIEIDTGLRAMLNFYEKYKTKLSPMVLAPIIHFLFVSVHPFIDGNGRVARLLHSFILIKTGIPIFAFDPDHRNPCLYQ